jgi:hypothetical protein
MSSNNSIIVQIRRGTTAQTASFTGALAELTVDTDQKTIVVHDGVTPGGTTLSTKAFTQAAFDAANTATGTVGQLAFDKANSANVLAQAAFNAANNAQGTVGFLAFDKANGAYNQANTATTLAQNAFDAANNAQGTVGYLAFAKANAAFDVANTASNSTVVRWSAAYALAEIIKTKHQHNAELVEALKNICNIEEKNSVKKIYLAALIKINLSI